MAELAVEFARFAATAGSRTVLYRRLAAGVAQWEGLEPLFGNAPEPARRAVTLFAAVRFLLLEDPEPELARFYPDLADGKASSEDPVPAFLAYCTSHADQLGHLLATRLPQTNEIGRSSLLLVALARVADEVGALAQLDLGASAGLNLLIDRYAYDYAGHTIGDGPIRLSCGIRRGSHCGELPARVPHIASRLGLDRAPVDLADPDGVRWLRACVWPDEPERLARLDAAIALARESGVRVLSGELVADLPAALARLGAGHPVVTTSWVLTYLSPSRRAAFLAALDEAGADRDLSWVSVEQPTATPGLRWPEELVESELSVLRLVRWRGGVRDETCLAECHPHGLWLRWL